MTDNIKINDETDKGINSLVVWAGALQVTTPMEHDRAMSQLKGVKLVKASVLSFFAPMKESAHASWKTIVAQEKSYTDKLDAVEKTAKGIILDYQMKQEAIRLEEQRVMQAKADEAARKEREKLEARAAKAEASGKGEKAAALQEQAAMIEAPVIQVASTVTAGGSSIRKTWTCKVIDIDKLDRCYMVPNQQALDSLARSTKGTIKIAGCVMVEEAGLSVRTK
jgi:hypothetical protein